jgi:hypothetical protein
MFSDKPAHAITLKDLDADLSAKLIREANLDHGRENASWMQSMNNHATITTRSTEISSRLTRPAFSPPDGSHWSN